jgi:hypothetical protein
VPITRGKNEPESAFCSGARSQRCREPNIPIKSPRDDRASYRCTRAPHRATARNCCRTRARHSRGNPETGKVAKELLQSFEMTQARHLEDRERLDARWARDLSCASCIRLSVPVLFGFRRRSAMTFPASWYAAARDWRMRAAETLALADEMKETEPKAMMLRIAADYERLAEWAEKHSSPWWDKKRAESK